VATSKAQQFALIAEGLGWAVRRIKRDEKRQVIATREAEKYVLMWGVDETTGRDRFLGGSYRYDTHHEPVRLVKAAIEAMSKAPQTQRVHDDGELSRLPFDPAHSTDNEILAAVLGKKIIWRSALSGLDDEGTVSQDKRYLRIETMPTNGKRILTFVSPLLGGFRSVDINTIRKVY